MIITSATNSNATHNAMAKKKNGSTPGGKSKRKRSLSTEDEERPPPPEESPMHDSDDDDSDDAASASASEEEGEGEEEVLSEESGDDGEEYSAPAPAVQSFKSDGRYHNKQRCLTLCSRGVTARYRHLLEDLRTLIPHAKKESKLDPGKAGSDLGGGMAKAINDIAEMRSCSTVLFLECRKRMDAYLWVGKAGPSASGPSVKFEVSNVHTMDELRLTGNCMKGSRPVLTFDESFDRIDELRVIKALFVDVFGCPRGHPKSKPFVDRVMGFYYADGKVRSLITLCSIWLYLFIIYIYIYTSVFMYYCIPSLMQNDMVVNSLPHIIGSGRSGFATIRFWKRRRPTPRRRGRSAGRPGRTAPPTWWRSGRASC